MLGGEASVVMVRMLIVGVHGGWSVLRYENVSFWFGVGEDVSGGDV